MKTRILEILKQATGTISGEELSSRLNVSRVTIWKHIKALQELGYRIHSGPKGYSYRPQDDFLYPWEFGDRQPLIHHYESLDSTMDTARELARKGAADRTVVIAETQEKGRGRLQRTWHSQKGGLYFTLTLRPKIPAPSGFLVNFIASTALVEAIREYTGVEAQVKWPNDILVGRQKLSGMISEMETDADMVAFINIGIGLNVNNDPSGLEKSAASLAGLVGHELSRKALLELFLDKLSTRLEDLQLDSAVRNWKKYTMTIGRQVQIDTMNESTRGKALDVDDTGALVLELEDGTTRKVVYGDCFHV
jgi:BirA family biotin operon repressor/biotin-[acetyl-CoA-carboxylase] ligase